MSMHNGASTHQLESDINRDRSEIAQTLDEIEQRFSPGQMMDQALSYLKGHGGDFSSNLVDTVCKNPISSIMAGVGVAMLAVNQSRSHHHADNASQLKNKAAGQSQQAKRHMADAKDRARETWDSSMESARHLSSEGRTRAASAAQEASHYYRENPLVVGAAAITIGALIGSLFHTTHKEQALFGRQASDAVGQVKDKAHKAKAIGEESLERVKQRSQSTTDKPEHNSRSDMPEPDSSQFEKHYIV